MKLIKTWLRFIREWIRHHALAFFVGLGAVALGAWLEFSSSRIWESTVRIFQPEFGQPDWIVMFFWSTAFVWIIAFANQLGRAETEERRRIRELEQTIVRAPNPMVFKSYQTLCLNTVSKALLAMEPTESDTPNEKMKHLAEAFQLILEAVAKLAATFRGTPDSKAYGANIMLLVGRASTGEPFPTWLVDQLRFHRKNDSRSLEAMLYLHPSLMLRNRAEATHPAVPVFAIPVPDRSIAGYERLMLPGAASALVTGKSVVYEDTRGMAKMLSDFDILIREEVTQYFSDDGEGKAIVSFASYQITDGQSPLGVLNIDCSETGLLGPEPEHYPTFDALVASITRMIAPQVVQYARLLQDTLGSLDTSRDSHMEHDDPNTPNPK